MINNIRIGGVDEAFNIPWKRLCRADKTLHWKDFDGGTGQLMRALNNGELDMAVVLTEGAVLDIIKNDKAAILCFYVSSPLEWGIHVAENSDIKSIEDIRGKTIAISRFGSGSHLMPMLMASELGWDIESMRFHESLNLNGGIRDLMRNTAQVFFWEKHTTAPYLKNNHLVCIGSYFSKWPAFSIAIRKSDCGKSETYKKVLATVLQNAQDFKNNKNSIDDITFYYQMQKETAAQWIQQTNWISIPAINLPLIEMVIKSLNKGGLINALPLASSCVCS